MKRVLVLACLAAATSAHADEDTSKASYRAVLDRVDLEPSSLTGYRMRVYLSALALQGQLLDLTDPKSIKLYLGASEKKKVPYALGRYDATGADTAIVIMVQTSVDYGDALPQISDSIDRDFLTGMNDRTQVAVMPFGETTGSGKLTTIKTVRGKIQIGTDNSAGDPALLDTLDRALRLLKKAKTEPEGKPLRKVVVIVGDGRDLAGDKDRVTRAGKRADKEGVRVHTIAYSPNDVRRPMLALGELSKRSMGTFRWVRKGSAESWKAAFQQLHDEIAKQYVITYFVNATDEVAGKKLHIVTVGRTETTSNEVKVPSPMCGAVECTSGYCANGKCIKYKDGGGRGVLGWILLIVGILVGIAIVLGVVGFFLKRAEERRHAQPQVPGQPAAPKPPKQKKQKKQKAEAPAAVAPGLLPNGRPIPALLVLSGPRTGERHMLFNGFLVGKQPGCNLIIEDGYTSSQHAQIGMDVNGMCKLYDRGSTNGTFVNGVRITETALQHGNTIRIGSTEFRFLAE